MYLGYALIRGTLAESLNPGYCSEQTFFASFTLCNSTSWASHLLVLLKCYATGVECLQIDEAFSRTVFKHYTRYIFNLYARDH